MIDVVAGGVLLMVLAFAFVLAFTLIGSHVDTDGWLHEPFALIPLAWLSGSAGVVLLAAGLWRPRRQRDKRRGNGAQH